jgi:ferric-dicitrate binding protein FerR (iron transport regulator)
MNIPEDIHEIMLDHLAGCADERELQRLQAWIAASPGHAGEWRALCALWYSGVAGGRRSPAELERAWARLCRRRAQQVWRRRVARAGIAAAVVVAAALFLLPGSPAGDEQEELTGWLERREREQVTLELADGRPVPLEGPSELREGDVLITNDSARLSYRATGDGDAGAMHRLVVPRGGEYRLTLADGTAVTLNAGSTLRFPARFPPGRREVWLSGEGYFQVASSPASPFSVHANGTVTTALGTEFNVNAYDGEETTGITLVTGIVEVAVGARVSRLAPGYRVAVDNATGEAHREQVYLPAIIAWKDGVLRFDDIPLDELMRRLERWYDVPFVFRREEVKRKSFSGGFRRYERLERVLQFIEQVNDVTFTLENDTIIMDIK